MENRYILPFLMDVNTPHHTIPFDKIKLEDYEPAVKEGIRQQNENIQQIIENKETPNFKNTIIALEQSGALLDRVSHVFGNLLSAETSDEMQALAQSLMPLMSEHSNSITLNEELFKKIRYVYEHREEEHLTEEELKLLEDVYKGFERSGATLDGTDKDKYKELSSALSLLSLQFGEHVLKATNEYILHLTSEEDVKGLPASALAATKENAQERGLDGWVITLQAPDFVPFMTYADNRKHRETLYMAYSKRCTAGENNNLEIVKEIVNHEMQIAQLLGYPDYATYTLKERMAENSSQVYGLLHDLLNAYLPAAKAEVKEVQALAQELEGDDFVLMPWDWNYYAQKLKDKKFSINDEMLRPYFELSKVKEGVFGLATRLYGITFQKNEEIPVYHKDVEAYEVFDKDGTFLAVLYTDFHPRASKRSGAWMTNFKEQWKEADGTDSRPHVSIVMNFTKPTKEQPSLLTLDEVETLLHEFGHSLHSIFSNTTYSSLSGTNVYWDFVELPSQFMENFAKEKEFLHTFATHYQTGEMIPDVLVDRINASANFNAGYACIRQVSFGLLDMAWYTRTQPFDGDVIAYEKEAFLPTRLLPSVEGTCMSTQFSHIFAGGYSAGYYSYKWAEVLDADAFEMFRENGIFDRATADKFRYNILSRGGTEHPMKLYKAFRGKAPSVDALLKRNGIKKA